MLDKLLPAGDIEPNTELKSAWNSIRNFTRFPELRNSVKKYLSAQSGRMYEIKPGNWKSAIFLPVQQFRGGVGPQEIYRESTERPERKRRQTISGVTGR